MRLTYIILSLLPTLGLSARLSFSIPPSNLIPNPSSLPPSTKASLTTLSTTYTAPLNIKNAFSFRNVSAGSYLFEIQCATHAFAPLRVDVSSDGSVVAWRTYRGNEWDNKGEELRISELNAVELKVLGPKDYYMERAGFSPLSILKNPMILLAGVGMVVVFGMPYILDNLDPETKAEMEAARVESPLSGLLTGQQAKSKSSAANFDAAAWLAGSGKKSEGSTEKGVSR